MAGRLSLNPNPLPLYLTGSMALTGGPINATVVFKITTPSGGYRETAAQTDATGAIQVPIVANTVGPASVTVVQRTETVVATVAAAVVGSV